MSDVIEKPALNGVNTPVLLATINAVGGQPELTVAHPDGRGGTSVDVRFESNMLAAWPADRGDATELFRIAQEATTNAMRHAAARHIHIRLTVAAESLTLSVDDDGIGFDPTAVAGVGVGSGLRNLHARAEAIGASLLLRSAPGRGTYIECVLPRVH